MELLAPAGGAAALKAAVYNGADAVYLGLGRFNARAKAENFNLDNLREAVEFCHLYGVKVFVALNTLLRDEELNDALRLVLAADNARADAVIVQDLGLARRIRENCGILMHASTQMGIHNAAGAAVARKLGFSRVILAREAMLEDIAAVAATGIETEVFVQGALCVAFSGNCYFSSLVSGCSGNRGKCLQLCRKPYMTAGHRGYYFSTADLMLASRLSDLAKAGVTAVKLEGRLRRPEYVAAAVRLYRAALDGGDWQEKLDELKRVYNRGGYCQGYLDAGNADVIFPTLPGHIGKKIGKVVKTNGNSFTADVKLYKGDGLKFLRHGAEVGNAAVVKDGFESGFLGMVRSGDEIRLTSDARLNEELLLRVKKIRFDAKLAIVPGKKPRLELTSGGAKVVIEGEKEAEAAVNQAISYDFARSAIGKTGGTAFTLANFEYAEKNAFIELAALNAIRRQALQTLKREIIALCESRIPRFDASYCSLRELVINSLEIKGDAAISETVFEDFKDNYCYLILNPRRYSVADFEPLRGKTQDVILMLPLIARTSDLKVLQKIVAAGIFDKFAVNNLYGLQLAAGHKIILWQGMNIVNNDSGVSCLASIEAGREILNSYVYAYGRPALMTFAHCPKRTQKGDCRGCEGYDIAVSDDKKQAYRLRRYRTVHCYAELRPQNPVGSAVKNRCRVFDFTGAAQETGEEKQKLLSNCKRFRGFD